MGQDYSYSQPSSSSDSLDITSLLEAEAQMYKDEAEKADDGIPTQCYCGAVPIIGCSYTPKDPYRRYFTCHHVDDGDCHVWKWWDVAVMEEMRDFHRELRQLKAQGNESEQKLVIVEKTLSDISKKESGVKQMICVLVLICLVFVIMHGFKGDWDNSRVSLTRYNILKHLNTLPM
ncbi:hypothetical protein N665_0907s0002 [Sinapis alba]|nr:hypothetical protein N665_0907s0002 [Sinapis alba]